MNIFALRHGRPLVDLNLRDCLIYLDYVIIFSTTFEEHLDRLEAVISRLKQHNLKLKPSKCDFSKAEVTYLGQVVSEEGICTDPNKLESVQKRPVPIAIKEVRSYLGFTGYYRRFIKDYAKIARPLNDFLVGHYTSKKNRNKRSKPAPFVWTKRQQRSFDKLKNLIKSPVRAYADYSKHFKIHTDASTTGLGAVLYQNQDRMEGVVAYASRSLKPSEKNYLAHKLEFLALKLAITEKFQDYLYGATFSIVTDNNLLTYDFTTAKLDATCQRWLAELPNYSCTIIYTSGRQNLDADGLSRIRETETSVSVFPNVLQAVCNSLFVEHKPLVNSLTDTDHKDIYPEEAYLIKEEEIKSTALMVRTGGKLRVKIMISPSLLTF